MTEGELPGLKLGERAFEIVMARQMAAGELQTAWFARHGSTPITEVPAHWPEEYRRSCERRLDAIRVNPNIALIERPEYKRRWTRAVGRPGERALRAWLLDRLESTATGPTDALPRADLQRELAERTAHDADFLQVAALYAGRPDFACRAGRGAGRGRVGAVPARAAVQARGPAQAAGLGADLGPPAPRGRRRGRRADPRPAEVRLGRLPHVRHLAASGQARRAQGAVRQLPALPRDGDPSLVVGWAGWDHLRQATALAALLRADEDPRGLAPRPPRPPARRARPARPLALQWHNEVDPEFDLRMGDYYRDFLRDEAQALGQPWTRSGPGSPRPGPRGEGTPCTILSRMKPRIRHPVPARGRRDRGPPTRRRTPTPGTPTSWPGWSRCGGSRRPTGA